MLFGLNPWLRDCLEELKRLRMAIMHGKYNKKLMKERDFLSSNEVELMLHCINSKMFLSLQVQKRK